MDKVIAFGDSFTWGSDMHDTVRADLGHWDGSVPYTETYSKHTWHALLAKDLGYKYKCYAREGCSNQTIVRTFFERLAEFNKNDLIIVNFTWRDRYDFLDAETIEWESIRPSSIKGDSKFAEMYYKHIHSHYWDNIESLKAINLVISILKCYNMKYIVTCIDDMIYGDNVHVNNTITSMRDVYKNEITWFDGIGFHQWSVKNKFPISPMWHPLEEAHKQALKKIKEQHEFTE